MGRSRRRTDASHGSRGAKPLPLLQAVWEQVAGEVLSAPAPPGETPGEADAPGGGAGALDGTTIAEDSLEAAGIDLWGPVAVVALGDVRDTARQIRVMGGRMGCIGALVLDLRGVWRAGPEWACALLAGWTRYRALGCECLIAAGGHADRVRALPGIAGGLVFGTVEEAVWNALQIAGD